MKYEVLSDAVFWDKGHPIYVLDLIKYGSYIVATMIFSRNIIIYDIDSGSYIKYGTEKQDIRRPQNYKSIIWRDKVYIFPFGVGEDIVVFDLIRMEYLDCIRFKVDSCFIGEKCLAIQVFRNKFWLFIHNSSRVYSLNPENTDIESFDLEDGLLTDSVFLIGDELWLTERNECNLLQLTPELSVKSVFHIKSMSLTEGHLWISSLIKLNDHLIGFSSFRDCCFVLDLDTNEDTCYDFSDSVSRIEKRNGSLYRTILPHDCKAVLLPHSIDRIVVVDPINKTSEEYSSELSYREIMRYYQKKDEYIHEIDRFGLKELIMSI